MAKRISSIKQLQFCLTESKKSVEIFGAHGAALLPGTDNQKQSVRVFKQACDAVLAEYLEIAKSRPGGLGMKKEEGFRELVHKDIGRYDLSLTQLIDTHYSSKTKRPLSENEKNILRCKEKIEDRVKPVLANILGENFVINSFGAVISHPGTSAQDWHVDSCHLFSKSEGSLPVLPCHFVSVFLPLYSFDEVIGPTEMALGTQYHTHCLENGTVEDQYPEASVVSQLLGKEGVSCITVDADPGDIVIMDGRVLHRGKMNRSDAVRTLMYLSFCKPWYFEFPRSTNDGRSLFD